MRAGQRAVVKPSLDRPFIQRDAGKARAQLQRRGDRGAGVDDLVAPNERRQRQVEELCLRLHDKPAALLEGIELLAPDHERRADRERLRRGSRPRPLAPAAQ